MYAGNWNLGSKEGKGVEFDMQGNKKYEGDWLNNNPHGEGILYISEKGLACCPKAKTYVGHFQNS